jgi:hypothetical protein
MILVTLSFWGWLFIWQNAVFDEGMRFVGLREEPLESPVNRFVKRAMDLAVAVPVVALVLPATTLAVWLAQRFQSPGPVFLFQTRSGMMGRPFKMIKYRTMHVHNPDEARQASQGDSRIFPAGRWLRKTSLDELFTQAMRTYVILSSRLAKTRHRQTACSCARNWANSSTSSRPARISSSRTARPSWAPTMPPCSCTRRPCPVARRGRAWRNFF